MGHSQQVADVYAGQSVLVTGASGFLGKVLIEKLLYSVDSLKNIYLLIRPKNGLGPKQRMDTIIQVCVTFEGRNVKCGRFKI